MAYIEDRDVFYRDCDCGENHEVKFITGVLCKENGGETDFSVALINHQDSKHIWLSFILQSCKGICESLCSFTSHIYIAEDGVAYSIQNASKSPFQPEDIFEAYDVSRDEVLKEDGLKESLIDEYQLLFKTDKEIGLFLVCG